MFTQPDTVHIRLVSPPFSSFPSPHKLAQLVSNFLRSINLESRSSHSIYFAGDGRASPSTPYLRDFSDLFGRYGITCQWFPEFASVRLALLSPRKTHKSLTSCCVVFRISLEDDVGQPYLTPGDFFKNGVPASIIVRIPCSSLPHRALTSFSFLQATTVVVTLGYGIMRLLGL